MATRADYLDAMWGATEARRRIEARPRAAEPVVALDEGIDVLPPDARRGPPFPLMALPAVVADYCLEVAAAYQVEPEMAAIPALVGLGAAIGNSRQIAIKPDFVESAQLWGLVIARPGSVKSKVQREATAPLDARDKRLRRDNAARKQRYGEALEEWEATPRPKRQGPRPQPEPPQRQMIQDSTIEELAYILQDNPRGVLVYQDEITDWVRGMNQYKQKGSDRSRWLTIWSGQRLVIDRRSTHGDPVYVDLPFAPVTGGIQPDLLRELRLDQGGDDGFIDRLLFAWPTPKIRRWTEASVHQPVRDAYFRIFDSLVGLDMHWDEWAEEYVPCRVGLTPEAKATWIQFYNEHSDEMAAPDFDSRLYGAWAKLDGYAARLSLIIHLSRLAAGEVVDETVDQESIEDGWGLVEYFKAGVGMVYDRMAVTEEDRRVQSVVEWMDRHKTNEVAARDLVRAGVGGIKRTDEVEALFKGLVQRGYGLSTKEAANGSGRKPLVFRRTNRRWEEGESRAE